MHKVIFFASVLFNLNCGFGQTLIKGHIIDSFHNKLMVYEPINNFCNTILTTSEWEIKPEPNGFFQYPLSISEPNMITIRIGLTPIWFFIEPNDTIEINIDLSKFTINSPNNGIVFKGKNATGNDYFNYYNYQPGRKLGRFSYIVDDSLQFHQTHDFKSIDYGLQSSTAYFDTLLKSKKITKTFYAFIVPAIKEMLIGTEISRLDFHSKVIPFQKAIEFANEIYERYPVTVDMIKHNIFGESIAFYYYFTKAAQFYPTPYLADSVITYKNQNLFINKNLVYWLYAPGDVQKVFWPLKLISLKKLFADSYSKKDIEAFTSLHPNSPVNKYLRPPYFGILVYNTKNPEIDSSFIKILPLPTTTNFNDFIEKNFKGKNLFIDFWASWCAPCKQEFQFNNALDSFCNKYNIAKLYISFDQPITRGTMTNDIYAYDLKGFHTNVNEYLYDDIKNTFYPGKLEFSIPRYILIDKNGKILNSELPRPSSGNELLIEIKKELNL